MAAADRAATAAGWSFLCSRSSRDVQACQRQLRHTVGPMDVAYISAVAALAGSVIGGLTSTGTTWLTQRAQTRAGQFVHELERRQDLYRDFIVAASKAYGDALMSNDPHIAELVELSPLPIPKGSAVRIPKIGKSTTPLHPRKRIG